jgi:pSer/pThr/pTyr-binding forkhead associated (FHA) protein
MNKIIINRGSFKLDEVVLEQGTTTIGRGSDNTIVLDDTAISSHHTKIITLFHTSYIEDLDSTNGTLVNGKSVQKRSLHSGDVVSIGNHQLLFQSDKGVQTDSETSETVMLRGNEIKQRLNEFIQAQSEQEKSQPTTGGTGATSKDAIPNPSVAASTPAASKPAFSASANLEKNQAWLDAYKKSMAAKNPQPVPEKTAAAVNDKLTDAADAQPKPDTQTKTDAVPKSPLEPKADAQTKAEAVPKPPSESIAKVQPKTEAVVPKPPSKSTAKAHAFNNTAAALKGAEKPAAAPPQVPGTPTTVAHSTASTAGVSNPTVQAAIPPLDIAQAARMATQHASHPTSNQAPQHMSQQRRKQDNDYDANGAMALNPNKFRAKIMPMIWAAIVAVLVAEVVYITYRSIG